MGALDTLDSKDTSGQKDEDIKTKEMLDIKGVGKIPLQSAIGSNLVKNLEAEIQRRTGGFLNPMLEGLKDAVAVTSRDPGSAMASRDQEKRLQQESIFAMRNQIAAIQQAQKQQEIQANAIKTRLGGGAGAAPGAAPAAGALPDNIAAQVDYAINVLKDPAKAQAIIDDWEKQERVSTSKARYGKQEMYWVDGKGNVPMTGDEYQTFKNTRKLPTGEVVSQTAVDTVKPVSQTAVDTAKPVSTPTSGFDVTKNYGTPTKLLDNLKVVESSKDQFALHPESKAMGAYQFTPETVQTLHKMGIKFNPFDENEARAAADWYINQLASKNGGDYKKALAQYGGFITKDPTAYVNKVLTGVDTKAAAPSAAVTTQAAGFVAPPPMRGETPDAYNARVEQAKKDYEAARQVQTKEKEASAEVYGKEYGNIPKNKETATDTIAAANRVIAMANDPTYKKLMGYFEGGNKTASAIVKGLNWLTFKQFGQEEFENALAAATFSDAEKDRLRQLRKDVAQLGIEYTATMFKGSRLGIGLEKLGSTGKGVSTEFSPETNKRNAQLTKNNSEFVLDSHRNFRDSWLPSHPGKTWGDFINSKEYDKMLDQHLEKMNKLYPGVVTKLSVEEAEKAAKGETTGGSKFDKFRKKG